MRTPIIITLLLSVLGIVLITIKCKAKNMKINMNIKLKVLSILAFFPFLASSTSYDCSVDDSVATVSRVACCRASKDFGLFSCESGPEPRKILLAIDIPEIRTGVSVLDHLAEKASIKGSYGLLAPDKETQEGGNKVSYVESSI